MNELTAIHKEDPYKDDRLDIEEESILTWYYLRDVWKKSCDIYGEDVVNLWVRCIYITYFSINILNAQNRIFFEQYRRFTADIDQRVSYEAVYGWQRHNLLPQETPLFKWLFSHRLKEIVKGNDDDNINRSSNNAEGEGLPVVKRAIRANASKLAITYALYLYTSSYSLWAETLHSICDLTNQGLLFLSIRLSATDPDFNHPYGCCASRWVVSFLSGTVLFGMGLNAMYGSLHDSLLSGSGHILHDVKLGILLCGVSAILELYSFIGAYREIRKHTKKEKYTLPQYLAHGTDSTSIHVFLEDGTGLVCSMLAGMALTLTHLTNYSTVIFDVIGSTVIGGCLSSIT